MSIEVLLRLGDLILHSFEALADFFLGPVPVEIRTAYSVLAAGAKLLVFFRLPGAESLYKLLYSLLQTPNWINLLIVALPVVVVLLFIKWILDWLF